mmetsp:Transcript_19506/g.47634  ORF Transcript_19506/g.47634 Transcript_19506/m.47634 type:complete len:200 (-) Transcript_19506:242-841(-)
MKTCAIIGVQYHRSDHKHWDVPKHPGRTALCNSFPGSNPTLVRVLFAVAILQVHPLLQLVVAHRDETRPPSPDTPEEGGPSADNPSKHSGAWHRLQGVPELLGAYRKTDSGRARKQVRLEKVLIRQSRGLVLVVVPDHRVVRLVVPLPKHLVEDPPTRPQHPEHDGRLHRHVCREAERQEDLCPVVGMTSRLNQLPRPP